VCWASDLVVVSEYAEVFMIGRATFEKLTKPVMAIERLTNARQQLRSRQQQQLDQLLLPVDPGLEAGRVAPEALTAPAPLSARAHPLRRSHRTRARSVMPIAVPIKAAVPVSPRSSGVQQSSRIYEPGLPFPVPPPTTPWDTAWSSVPFPGAGMPIERDKLVESPQVLEKPNNGAVKNLFMGSTPYIAPYEPMLISYDPRVRYQRAADTKEDPIDTAMEAGAAFQAIGKCDTLESEPKIADLSLARDLFAPEPRLDVDATVHTLALEDDHSEVRHAVWI
jgi:hypothetical protein